MNTRQTNKPVAAKPVSSSGAKNLTFTAGNYTREGVSLDKVNEVHESFALFDLDGEGTIDLKGTAAATQSSRAPWSPWASTPGTRPSST